MPTIHDVARSANVSIATVSRVVNGDRSVHPALRRAVEEAVRASGYRPNAAARSLRRARAGAIGVVVSELANPVFNAIVHGISRAAADRELSLFLCDSDESYAAQGAHLEQLHQRRVDGVITYPLGDVAAQVQPLRDDGIPVVVIGQRIPGGSPPELVVDEDDASCAALQLLLGLGHRRIALLVRGGSDRSSRAAGNVMAARIAVYRRAHAKRGLPVDESLVVRTRGGAAAQTAVAALLQRPDPPTAIIVGIHTDAPEALLAIRQTGLRVPQDISLISYGDSRWAEVFEPPITVVRSDYAVFGRRAAELLFAVADGSTVELTQHHPAELVVRGSCAPPTR